MYRGSFFSTFNRHEYFTLVRINSGDFDDDKINERLNNNESLEDFYEKQDLDEISKTNKNKSAGRKKNARFPFMTKHPLAGTYHQTLISKQCTCILSGKPPPSYPGNCDKNNSKKYNKWKKKADSFATYYMIGFKPNSGFDGKLSYTWEEFCDWVKISERGSFVDRMRIKTVFNIIRGLKLKKSRS